MFVCFCFFYIGRMLTVYEAEFNPRRDVLFLALFVTSLADPQFPSELPAPLRDEAHFSPILSGFPSRHRAAPSEQEELKVWVQCRPSAAPGKNPHPVNRGAG